MAMLLWHEWYVTNKHGTVQQSVVTVSWNRWNIVFRCSDIGHRWSESSLMASDSPPMIDTMHRSGLIAMSGCAG